MPQAAQKCMSKSILVKKAVQITAPYAGAALCIALPPAQGAPSGIGHHNTQGGRCGFSRSRFASLGRQFPVQGRGLPMMDFIARHGLACCPGHTGISQSGCTAQAFGSQQLCTEGQQTKPRLASTFFNQQRVGYLGPKHLQAAADAHQRARAALQALTGKLLYQPGQAGAA